MSISINCSAKEIFEITMDSIINKKSFLNIRIGDGEMKVLLSKKNDESSMGVFKNFCVTQLGYVLDDKNRQDIIRKLENTIIGSDVLGIPNQTMINSGNKFWISADKYISDLFKKNNLDINKKKYASAGCHYDLFSQGFIELIIKNIDKIVIISGRDVKNDFLKKYSNIKNIEYYKIPPEQNFELISSPSNFYPKLHAEIKKSIDSKDRSGEFLLYGAGFAGKDLGLYFKNNGGVAIDLGSIFDSWDGRITRGKQKGKGKTRAKLI